MELAEWWEKFSTAYDDERHAMIEEARRELQSKPQAPRVRVKRPDAEAGSTQAERATTDAADVSGEQGDAPPAKKRRRRRKPANRGGAGGEGASGDAASPSADTASNT